MFQICFDRDHGYMRAGYYLFLMLNALPEVTPSGLDTPNFPELSPV
jgi:hypothetical protein